MSARDATYLAENIPDTRLVTFEGAGHLINLEVPAAFRERVVEFMQADGDLPRVPR